MSSRISIPSVWEQNPAYIIQPFSPYQKRPADAEILLSPLLQTTSLRVGGVLEDRFGKPRRLRITNDNVGIVISNDHLDGDNGRVYPHNKVGAIGGTPSLTETITCPTFEAEISLAETCQDLGITIKSASERTLVIGRSALAKTGGLPGMRERLTTPDGDKTVIHLQRAFIHVINKVLIQTNLVQGKDYLLLD